MRRDWTYARAKVERERICRMCRVHPRGHVDGADCEGNLESAHIIGRKHDPITSIADDLDDQGRVIPHFNLDGKLVVSPVRVVPLCRKHHAMYDDHDLDILPTLTRREQAQAVVDAHGIVLAFNRTTGGRASPAGDE